MGRLAKNGQIWWRGRKDHRYPVGLFDVISTPETKQNFRVLINKKRKLFLIEIPEQEAKYAEFPDSIQFGRNLLG